MVDQAVYSAIKRSGSRNFWELQNYLPKESSNHVKKFIATQYIMEGSTAIAVMNPTIQATPKKYFNPLEKGTIALDTTKGMQTEIISGRYNSLIIAKHIMLDIASFNALNPSFDAKLSVDESTYNLRLTPEKMQLFRQNKLQIMNESLYLFLSLNNVQPTYNTPATLKVKKGKG
jgi:membrane-bound lytic murein transglycosylase D